VFGKRR